MFLLAGPAVLDRDVLTFGKAGQTATRLAWLPTDRYAAHCVAEEQQPSEKLKRHFAIATIAAVPITIVISSVCASGRGGPVFNCRHCRLIGADMGCEPRRLSSIGLRRGAASPARAGGKFGSSRLLAIIALVAASTVSAHAQTNWTGAFSNGWFNSFNWTAGVPGTFSSVNIDAVTPNSTEIRGTGATAQNLAVGQNGTGMLTIRTGGTLVTSFTAIGNLPGSTGTVIVTDPGSNWSNAGSIVVGGQGTGTLTIQNGGTVSSGGSSVGLSVGSNGTVTVTGTVSPVAAPAGLAGTAR